MIGVVKGWMLKPNRIEYIEDLVPHPVFNLRLLLASPQPWIFP